MKNIILNNIESFLEDEQKQGGEIARYQSWNIVYEDFDPKKGILKEFGSYSDKCIDALSRSLTIYLASWGMMRGSSKLLTHYNYRIHKGAVSIIIESLEALREYPKTQYEVDVYIDKVLRCYQALEEYYADKKNYGETKELVTVSPTPTLITKIMLGTSGSTPAYDEYFKAFVKDTKLKNIYHKEKIRVESLQALLNQLWKLYFDPENDLSKYEKKYGYPPMKLIDMAGFNYGLTNKPKA